MKATAMIDDKDLAEFSGATLTGVTVGIGSLVLLFGTDAQVLLQCKFESHEQGGALSGHGEDVSSSPRLFGFLNHQVAYASMDMNFVLSLHFDDGRYLRVVPERNGLESYVITTRHGICPVAISG